MIEQIDDVDTIDWTAERSPSMAHLGVSVYDMPNKDLWMLLLFNNRTTDEVER
jgi:hypothetical protein